MRQTNKFKNLHAEDDDDDCIDSELINPLRKQEKDQQMQQVNNSQTPSIFTRISPALRVVILLIISILAFISRIFSVIRYESIIHQFDPWFNYRSTIYLVQNGFYKFWGWFDSETWYPLGRVIGGTIYPGLMSTAAGFYWVLEFFGFPVQIRNVCVFIAPFFSALTAIATYFLTKQVTKKPEPGLLAALFISIVPSYMSRSVAGSYDNEGVAIFAMIFTFYLYVKAMNTGSIITAMLSSLSYFYMVTAWGGYSFIIMFLSLYNLCMLFVNRFTHNMYIAYNVFYVLGIILATQVPFVSFLTIKSSQHLPFHAVFLLTQVYIIREQLKRVLDEDSINYLGRITAIIGIIFFGVVILFTIIFGGTYWQGRTLSILNPSYAAKHQPIIASVSEHQPTTWSGYFFDLSYLIILMPIGLFFSLYTPNAGKIFIALYGVISLYTSCVMIRLMLVLAPAVCILSAIGVYELNSLFLSRPQEIVFGIIGGDKLIQNQDPIQNQDELKGQAKSFKTTKRPGSKKVQQRRYQSQSNSKSLPLATSLVALAILGYLLTNFVEHSVWTAAQAYASPSIILASTNSKGEKKIIDDFREAYTWIKQNTPQDAKILSWWDYGYQITGMANRTVIADNNTWNTTHIASIGKVLSLPQKQGYDLARQIGANYVLVIFGGLSHYSGDDINKFLWIVRIVHGVYPQISDDQFLADGQYRIDEKATQALRNSLMYKFSYHKFGEILSSYGNPAGYDVVRGQVVGDKNIELKYFDEVYSSEHWMVRIYKLRDPQEKKTPTISKVNIKEKIDLSKYNSKIDQNED